MRKTVTSVAVGALAIVLAVLSAVPVAAEETVPTLEQVGQINVTARGMVFAAPYLYLLTEAGIVVYDLGDPASPEPTGSYAATNLSDMTLQGERLYATDGLTVTVIDISQPAKPTFAFGIALTGFPGATAVAVEGEWLYVLVTLSDFGRYSCELGQYRVSDPDQIVQGDTFTPPGDRRCEGSLFVKSNVAVFSVVSGQTHGGCCSYVWAVNIANDGGLVDPHPIEDGFPYALDLAFGDADTVYLAVGSLSLCGTPGNGEIRSFQVFPLSNRISGLSPARHETPCGTLYSALSVAGDRLYAARGVYGISASRLAVYDTANDERLVTSYDFPGSGFQIDAAADLVLVRGEDSIRLLHWVDAPVTARAFLPVSGNDTPALR